MKSLLIVRHAKSSWADPGQPDFERPLNDRGRRDAPMMAGRLWDQGIRIDKLVSSPANRAITTARHFAEVMGIAGKDILQVPRLYHASPETFFDVIAAELHDDWATVALFSHNPGITYFVNAMQVARVDNMPTCAVFGVRAEIKSWSEFEAAEKRFWMFDYPKNV